MSIIKEILSYTTSEQRCAHNPCFSVFIQLFLSTLSEEDLNRNTIEIFYDLKAAKRSVKKEQRVIKVPNSNVFNITAPILRARGISRIVSSELLIAL